MVKASSLLVVVVCMHCSDSGLCIRYARGDDGEEVEEGQERQAVSPRAEGLKHWGKLVIGMDRMGGGCRNFVRR